MSVMDEGAQVVRELAPNQLRPKPTRWRRRWLSKWDQPWIGWWFRLIHPRRVGWLGTAFNASGMQTASWHRCGSCGHTFSVCPADANWGDCLGDNCPSYDPHRDVSFLLGEQDDG